MYHYHLLKPRHAICRPYTTVHDRDPLFVSRIEMADLSILTYAYELRICRCVYFGKVSKVLLKVACH